MEYLNSKEEHYDLLQAENHKHKKKRVSFSIFEAETMEEMEKLRRDKELELFSMLEYRNRANGSFGVVNLSINVFFSQL